MKKFEYQDEYQDPINTTWHKILEKQSMYIMGKKMKNFFSKKNKRNKKK